MASTRPHIYKSSSPCTSPMLTIPRASIIIGITVTFMFYSFFQFLSKELYFFSLYFNFTLWSSGTAKSTIRQVHFFSIIIKTGHLAVIRISVCISKCYILTFDPAQMPFKVMHRKEVTHSIAVMRGNRVGRNWLMKWDELKNPMILS